MTIFIVLQTVKRRGMCFWFKSRMLFKSLSQNITRYDFFFFSSPKFGTITKRFCGSLYSTSVFSRKPFMISNIHFFWCFDLSIKMKRCISSCSYFSRVSQYGGILLFRFGDILIFNKYVLFSLFVWYIRFVS